MQVVVVILIALLYVSANGWQHETGNAMLPEGSTCNLKTGGTGVCTRIEKCDAVIKREIKYANLSRCSFIQITEVICCPKSSKPGSDIVVPITTTTPRSHSIVIGNVKIDDDTTLWGQNGSVRRLPLLMAMNSTTTVAPTTTTTTTTKAPRITTTSTTTPTPIITTITTPSTTTVASVPIWSAFSFDNTPTPTPTTATVKTVATRAENIRPSKAACDRYNSENPARIVYHILDGKEAAPGDFPYIGGMLYPSERAGAQYDLNCGCSLISENFALTAAHCLPERPVLVRFGAVDWNPTDTTTYKYDAKIKDIIIHDAYTPASYYNDIALIEFTDPVPITPLVAPICLHSEMTDIDSTTPLKVAGWGITNIDTRSKSDVLMSTNITTVALTECNATHIDYGVSRKYARGLVDSQYCAFDPEFKKDSCTGDSGGPLSVEVGNYSELIGIVSFGNACGSILPSIYTRVAYYLDWIEQKVWPTPNDV